MEPFPLAPPGKRSVLYLYTDNRSSWGTRGIDAWYCGPSNDHCRCNKFYGHETRSYRISGSFDLFPQHCSLPDMSPEQHSNAVHEELIQSITAPKKPHKKKLLKRMVDALHKLATSQESAPIQRVPEAETEQETEPVQRVILAPPCHNFNKSDSKNHTETRLHTHLRTTRYNTPGTVPRITAQEPPTSK